MSDQPDLMALDPGKLLVLSGAEERHAINTKMTLLCRLGWHQWSRWLVVHLEIGHYSRITHSRTCPKCGYHELSYVSG